MKTFSLKKKLASRFMKKLIRIRSRSRSRRHHHDHAIRIRAAAYASMASAVGPRKEWSRALLRDHKLRKKSPRRLQHDDGLRDLSQLVPGGEAMDSCTLLNETPHYIKCLAAQVQIMTQILHYIIS